MEEQGLEARMTILEARLLFCEQRLATIERGFGGVIMSTRRRKRQLTPEEKDAVVARLAAGREAARKRREAEARAQVKKEKTDGASKTKDEG